MSALITIFRDAPPQLRTSIRKLAASDAQTRIRAVRELTKESYAPAANVMLEKLDGPLPGCRA